MVPAHGIHTSNHFMRKRVPAVCPNAKICLQRNLCIARLVAMESSTSGSVRPAARQPGDIAQELGHAVVGTAALKALAHPLRIRLLETLSRYGAQTASSLAARLGES